MKKESQNHDYQLHSSRIPNQDIHMNNFLNCFLVVGHLYQKLQQIVHTHFIATHDSVLSVTFQWLVLSKTLMWLSNRLESVECSRILV